MDVEREDESASQADLATPEEPWMKTRAGKRIAELQQVEENIAALLHFAGCTLASLHPDPLSSYTAREIATEVDEDDDEDADGQAPKPRKPTPRNEEEAKLAEFTKYAEGYYATLNDVQLALRTSIRHLRVSRVSPRPLTDPMYGSLVYRNQPAPSSTISGASNSRSQVGPGGIAFSSAALAPAQSEWDMRASRLPSLFSRVTSDSATPPPSMSVAALELERDALRDLVAALGGARRRPDREGGGAGAGGGAADPEQLQDDEDDADEDGDDFEMVE
ncbi:hypothetical protein JCM10908_005041 [Rhodotorula pacifica]|uniref:uncharacterized protein n=1 Tax=Rhodotorula pacifica TaxID=1495444 RepID=UPI0031828161